MSQHDSAFANVGQLSWRIGAISYLNARPLIDGLEDQPGVELVFDVPARLADYLMRGECDAALIPVVDLLRTDGALQIITDACIACDGEVLSVCVFSHVPPERVRRIYLDEDSRTSAQLVRLLWPEMFHRRVSFERWTTGQAVADNEAVLLIGDRAVSELAKSFSYQVDLGDAWKSYTGLPFVFAVWAGRSGRVSESLVRRLTSARDRGVGRLENLADQYGPRHGWSVGLARRYLGECLNYYLTLRHREGLTLFLDWVRSSMDQSRD